MTDSQSDTASDPRIARPLLSISFFSDTRLILLLGFGTLVVLVEILGYSAFRRAEQIYADVSAILARRKAIITLTGETDELNAASFNREQQNIGRTRNQFRAYLSGMFALALRFALVVTAGSSSRISSLERHREDERRRAEYAEQELRRLSQKLVQTQEDERKSISRELHDEIGQMVTDLRMELANIQMLRTAPETEFDERMSEAKGLAEKTLPSVRNVAKRLYITEPEAAILKMAAQRPGSQGVRTGSSTFCQEAAT